MNPSILSQEITIKCINLSFKCINALAIVQSKTCSYTLDENYILFFSWFTSGSPDVYEGKSNILIRLNKATTKP